MKYIILKGKVAISNNTHFIFLPLEMLSHYITAIYVSFSDTGYNITIFITIFISIVIIQHTKFLAVQYNDCHILGIKPTGWTHSRGEGQESSSLWTKLLSKFSPAICRPSVLVPSLCTGSLLSSWTWITINVQNITGHKSPQVPHLSSPESSVIPVLVLFQ